MAAENFTENVVEAVELAAEVGAKVAGAVESAFETTFADSESTASAEENTIMSYFTSFGIHIVMIIIVILLKWQYGTIESIEID